MNDIADYVAKAVKDARIVEGIDPAVATLPVGKVGIIGAGTMGGGIAMNFANVGIDVVIVETRQEALDRGLGVIRTNYERSAKRGRFPLEEVDVRMRRLSGSLDMAALADCDLIIEAVFEDMDLKKSIFVNLDKIVKPGAILATNTSGLNIDEIAAVTSRPECVIGLHFFSPANVMKLLEVVRGAKTSPIVVATAMRVATDIGKIAVIVGVCPGFVGNRMIHRRQAQAMALLARGVTPWDIDRVLTDFGFKMGVYEMLDMAGLDIGWKPGADTGNPVRDALCEMGRRGQKTGAGYYDYDSERRMQPSQLVADLIREKFGLSDDSPKVSDQEILETCLFPLVNEGAKILEEGMAQRPSDIDVVYLFGYGWPEGTGGPMRWADSVGLERIEAKAKELGEKDPAYKPAALLSRLVAENSSFASL